MPTSQRVLIRRGETSKSSATARRKFDDNDSIIDNSTTDDNYKTFTMNNTSLNDTKLCGTHKLITLQSAQYAIHLVSEFMRETAPQDDKQRMQQQRQKKTSSSSKVTFTKDLFDPLWQRLKDQGGGGISTTTRNNCSWRVSKSNNLLNPLSISRNWVYVPPKSSLTKLDDTKAATNNKGSTSSSNKQSKYKLGRDYYISEEQVVLNVLEDISTLDEVFDLYAMNAHYFSCIIPILDKAVTYNLKYEDAYAAWIGDDDHSDDNDGKQRKSTLPLDQHKSAKSKKRKSPRSSKGRTSYNDYGDYQYYDPDEWEKAGMEDNDDDDDDDGNKDECDACGEGGGEVMISTSNIHAVFIPSLFYLCI